MTQPTRWAILDTGTVSRKFCLGLAFAAGRPALIEKPRAQNAASARRIATAAGVFARLKSAVLGGTESLRHPFLGNGYAHEAAHLMDCVAAGLRESDVMPLSQSVEILEVLDRALAQVRGLA